MKIKRLPILGILMVMTLLLALVGVAYGLWFKTLEINGIVETSSLIMEWSSCICTDKGPGVLSTIDPLPDPWPYNYPKPPEEDQKDVANTVCTIDPDDPTILHLTVENGYPSYWNNCEVHFDNVGNLPVKIRGYGIFPKNFTLASANGAEDGEVWVKYWDGVGTQMEPCPDESCSQSGSLQFHVEQPAEELATYEFDVKVCVAQWNEEATGEACMAAAP